MVPTLVGVPVVLASASPRRRWLLGLLTDDVIVDPSGVPEPTPVGDPSAIATERARAKAAAVALRHPRATVVGSDTVVADRDGRLLDTPADRIAAERVISSLLDSTIRIDTAVCVQTPDGSRTEARTSEVDLGVATAAEVRAYVATGAADDTAAGLELQDRAAFLVRAMRGCPASVFGLPVCATHRLLATEPGAAPADLVDPGCPADCPVEELRGGTGR